MIEAPPRTAARCREAHARLAAIADRLNDDDVRRPSLVPGWTVGHVLAHLARNGHSMVRRIAAARSGESLEEYVGGSAGRAAEIERGAIGTAAELRTDVTNWASRLDEAFAGLNGEDWSRVVRTSTGIEYPVAELPWRRWRDVEIHLVDLAAGFGPADWSQPFLDRVLPDLLGQLPLRTDAGVLVAWLVGRGPAPELPPWA